MSAPTRKSPSPPGRASPNSRISPSVGVTSPQTIFMTVDLPAPFFPTNP